MQEKRRCRLCRDEFIPRYNNNYEWELLRLCTSFRFSVLGGANKLFNQFIREVQPQSIVSYCDRSKFNGNVYNKLRFDLVDEGSPSKHWSNNKKYVTDNLLRQRGYDQLFGTDYGKGTSNEELMLLTIGFLYMIAGNLDLNGGHNK